MLFLALVLRAGRRVVRQFMQQRALLHEKQQQWEQEASTKLAP
jgi:hypothetical protein